MIINTGQRTDIPAWYSDWFAQRLREGFVCVRNPYNPSQVNKYILNPDVVDVIGFCSKNPEPMFKYMDLLKDYGQYWFVTITPYGRDIEPNVPDKHHLLEVFKKLSQMVGINSIGWRYDPIFISSKYSEEYHLRAFETMAGELEGYTQTVVISFIDLFPKVARNFPQAKAVSTEQQIELGKEIIRIAHEHGMTVKPCAEGTLLVQFGADCGGCMTIKDYEKAIGKKLNPPNVKGVRAQCACYLACDIGVYSTCRHFCRYCYANADKQKVTALSAQHDVNSPFLVGNYQAGDKIHLVPQKSWIDAQPGFDGFL